MKTFCYHVVFSNIEPAFLFLFLLFLTACDLVGTFMNKIYRISGYEGYNLSTHICHNILLGDEKPNLGSFVWGSCYLVSCVCNVLCYALYQEEFRLVLLVVDDLSGLLL